jgi:hypothetical protein
MTDEMIRAERETVKFFDGLTVDGYKMPSGEYRVGIGNDRNWLGRVLERGGNTVKALQSMGFTQEIQKVVTRPIRGGGSQAQTISLRDFNRLIVYAVSDKKPAALALQLALTEVALNDFFRDAFGDRPLNIDEKRNLFYEAYAKTISPSDWMQMDKEDILRLALPGDEPQLQDGQWNE